MIISVRNGISGNPFIFYYICLILCVVLLLLVEVMSMLSLQSLICVGFQLVASADVRSPAKKTYALIRWCNLFPWLNFSSDRPGMFTTNRLKPMKGRLTSITLCYHTSFEKIGWGNIACVAWPYRNPGVNIFGLGSSQKRIYIKELSHHIHWLWNDSNSHRWICCRNSFDYGEANQYSDWGLKFI